MPSTSTITGVALGILTNAIEGSGIGTTYVACGTGAGVASPDDLILFAEATSVGRASATLTRTTTASAFDTVTATSILNFTNDATLTELGLFDASSGGNLITHTSGLSIPVGPSHAITSGKAIINILLDPPLQTIFNIIQNDSKASGSGGVSSVTMTFGSTCTSGNTMLAILAYDASSAVTTPSGWTLLVSKTGTNYAALAFYLKISNGTETGVTFNVSPNSYQLAVRFFEIEGTHALDRQATASGSGANGNYILPGLTPSTSSMIFSAMSYAATSIPTGNMSMGPSNWQPLDVPSDRELTGAYNLQPGNNEPITPLTIDAELVFGGSSFAAITLSII